MIATMLTIVVLALTGVSVGWFLRKRHVARRREERRCTKKRVVGVITYECNHTTTRRHLMIPASNDSDGEKKFEHFWERFIERFMKSLVEHFMERLGAWFHPYTFDECDDKECGYVKHVKGRPDYSKFFDSIEIAWRRFWYPEQFRSNEQLLVRAGVLTESVATVSERLRHVAWKSCEHAGCVKARLDKPPLLNVSRTHTKTQRLIVWVVSSPLAQDSMRRRRFPKD